MARELTEAARAAKEIRKRLRQRWPRIQFRVTSSNYSMGDSVRVGYRITTPMDPLPNAVERELDHWKRGQYNGMEDLYEYRPSSERSGPTTKHLSVSPDWSPIRALYLDSAMRHYGLDRWDDCTVHAKLGCWPWEALHRYLDLYVMGKKDAPEPWQRPREFTVLAVRQSKDIRVHPSLYLEWTADRDAALERLLQRAAPEVRARVQSNELQISAVGVEFVLAHPKRVVLDSESKRWVRPTEGGEWSTVHP